MPVSDEYLTYVLDQLRDLRGVTWRRMFGGVGLYAGGVIFAVLDDDQLFCRVDDITRPHYIAAGAEPWEPMPGREKPSRGYYQLPGSVLDDREEASRWAADAVEAATRRRAAKKKKPGTSATRVSKQSAKKPARKVARKTTRKLRPR